MFKPNKLKLWKHPQCYAGKTWEGFYRAPVGQSRDSDALERSNFRTAVDRLHAADERYQFTIVRESHWAVGWVEWIAIPVTAEAALIEAEAIAEDLEQYPILDESDFSELEQEDANETWANCFTNSERIEYIRTHRGQFEFRNLADALGCARGHYFAGYASELCGG